MKRLLATVLSSVGEIVGWMETDPAVLSVMPKEMISDRTSLLNKDSLYKEPSRSSQ